MVRGERLKNLWHRYRRYVWADAGIEAISGADVPVPPDSDNATLPLTQEPNLKAYRELFPLVNNITRMDKQSFNNAFNLWYEEHKETLNERTHDREKKTPPYMRPQLRSAYLSLKRNMKWLWTCCDYTDRIISNTNNGPEGVFSDIKSKIRVHSGMTKEKRKKLIDEYIIRHY